MTTDPNALFARSSHIENLLIHDLLAKLGQEQWRRDPWVDFEIYQGEVDDAGFDLVLGSRGRMRYVQVKQTHLEGRASKYSIRRDFAKRVGGCTVVLVYRAETLELDHCLFFGGDPGKTMPSVEGSPSTKATRGRTAEGDRLVRNHYCDVPRRRFEGPLTVGALLDRLFPETATPLSAPQRSRVGINII